MFVTSPSLGIAPLLSPILLMEPVLIKVIASVLFLPAAVASHFTITISIAFRFCNCYFVFSPLRVSATFTLRWLLELSVPSASGLQLLYSVTSSPCSFHSTFPFEWAFFPGHRRIYPSHRMSLMVSLDNHSSPQTPITYVLLCISAGVHMHQQVCRDQCRDSSVIPYTYLI